MMINPLSALSNLPDIPEEPLMPVLFMGHGSPMNAIEENEFTKGFREMGKGIPKPLAILCISAHWEAPGTFLTAMEQPQTIHDFGGFPEALYAVQYPAPGSPQLVETTRKLFPAQEVSATMDWGLDHGAWSVIRHLYPMADIPVVQMSLNTRLNPAGHYRLAEQLMPLRKKGVLIIGSGNMVHNLRMVSWDKLHQAFGFDWALEAQGTLNELIRQGNHQELISIRNKGRAFELAIPSLEHYLPMLYVLAIRDKKDKLVFYNDTPLAGSLTMTSFKLS